MNSQNAPRAPKIPPEPPKIINFLLHNKGVAGVAARVVTPATPWRCRFKIHRIRILSLLFSLHGVRAFRRARWDHGGHRPFRTPKSTKIYENRPKSTKINPIQPESTKINQN